MSQESGQRRAARCGLHQQQRRMAAVAVFGIELPKNRAIAVVD
jgi:hypothetical protein